MIFDGRGFAKKIEKEIRDKVVKMSRRPKLAVIVDPTNTAGVKYTQLKAKMAARLGVEFQILNLKSEILNKSQIIKLNSDPNVDGIMIQLPFPNSQFLIDLIDPSKDVDGLREDSLFKPAVVRAVVEILNSKIEDLNPFDRLRIPSISRDKFKIQNSKIVIVGANGFVGRKLVNALAVKDYPFVAGMDREDFDLEKLKTADVIISATGQANLINGSMVKNGFVAIDVGYPKAEFTPAALAKASWYTPVPGGVGPVTVVMLFANLLESCK